MRAIILLKDQKAVDMCIDKSFAQALRLNKLRDETYFANTRKGAELAATFSVMDFPAMVLIAEDGTNAGFWQGHLPSQAELSYAVGYI